MSETAEVNPKIEEIITAFEAKALHASRSGREVMHALTAVVAETSARSLKGFEQELIRNIDALANKMQAYAPTVNVLHRILASYEKARAQGQSLHEFQSMIADQANSYSDWSQQARYKIAEIGKAVIPAESVIYTFTLSETVLRTLLDVWNIGIRFRVLVTESRPNNDGRETAKLLSEAGIPVEVSIDACLGKLIQRADLMIVGAEAILADGSAICKVGTYPSALAAKEFGIPVYVLVDTMKFYTNSLLGRGIPLDQLDAADILDTARTEAFEVQGHLFDTTPGEYLTAIVTELGIMHPSQVSQWILSMPMSEAIVYRDYGI